MRPKRRILVVCDSDGDLSVMRFTLETHAYHVVSASSQEEAVKMCSRELPHLVMIAERVKLLDPLAISQKLKCIARFIPIIVMGDVETLDVVGSVADALVSGSIPQAELLARIKTMSMRKRGPRSESLKAAMNSAMTAAMGQ